MANESGVIKVKADNSIKIHKWKIREGFQLTSNQVILLYKLIDSDDIEIKRLKGLQSGVVKSIFFKDGDVVNKGYVYTFCKFYTRENTKFVFFFFKLLTFKLLLYIFCYCFYLCKNHFLKTIQF